MSTRAAAPPHAPVVLREYKHSVVLISSLTVKQLPVQGWRMQVLSETPRPQLRVKHVLSCLVVGGVTV